MDLSNWVNGDHCSSKSDEGGSSKKWPLLVLPPERQVMAHCWDIQLQNVLPPFMEGVSMIENQQGITNK